MKQKRLLEKSEELFWKYGYNAVSVDQIAAEAGISKMTIYKHFHSKEDLFIEVLKSSIEYHMNKVMELISKKNHTVEKIELMYNYSMGIAKEYPDILLRDIIEKKSILEKVSAIKLEKGLPIWQYILRDGISKNEIRELDFDFVSELLMNLPSAIKNIDFLKDKSKMIKFYVNFMDFIKYGLLGGMENQRLAAGKEGVEDAERCTHED
jgi:AcrR family transcriptional regulator